MCKHEPFFRNYIHSHTDTHNSLILCSSHHLILYVCIYQIARYIWMSNKLWVFTCSHSPKHIPNHQSKITKEWNGQSKIKEWEKLCRSTGLKTTSQQTLKSRAGSGTITQKWSKYKNRRHVVNCDALHFRLFYNIHQIKFNRQLCWNYQTNTHNWVRLFSCCKRSKKK